MAFHDSHRTQGVDGPLSEGSAYALASVFARDGQVLQITPPAVGSSEHRSNEHALLAGDKTEPRIAPQVEQDCVSGVRFSEGEAFGALKECHHLLVVEVVEWANLEHQ